MNISNRLTTLAADINLALGREATNRAEWVEIKLDLCRLTAEARTEFPSDNAFGDWSSDNISGINKNDRAAYIAMGADLQVARDVLTETDLSSIRRINTEQFQPRFPKVGKPAKPRGQRKASSQSAPSKEVEAAIIARMDRGESSNTIAAESGVPARDVRRIYEREVDRRAAADEAALSNAPLTASAQQKLDAHIRKFNKDFDRRVYEGIAKDGAQRNKIIEEAWAKRLGKLEKLWKSRERVFTKAEYAVLISVAHPDTGKHVTDEKRAEAFRLLNAHKIKLLDEKDFPIAEEVRDFVAEREARRAAYDAERKAQREAKKEASA